MNTRSPFTLFPAIDLRGGQVVRLKKGDPNLQTTYSSDPAETARRWIGAGCSWLHVVNLDGAFGTADGANQQALRAILSAAQDTGVHIQLGGGLRSLEAVTLALSLGIDRAILGTRAVEDPAMLGAVLNRWGDERVAVSLDALDGKVRVAGWLEGTGLDAVEAAVQFQRLGLEWLVFTDIARDGLGTGLNLSKTLEVAAASGLKVIASGGVSAIQDVEAVREAGLAGAIVGRALYEGAIDPLTLFRLEVKHAG